MPSAKTRTGTAAEQQDIERLKQRFTDLNVKKIQADTKLRESQSRLDELKRQAREQYGTDDLDELKRKLQAMKAENERLRAEYQQHLDGIEAELDRVTAEHKAAMSEDEES
jgi:hypothetical protein